MTRAMSSAFLLRMATLADEDRVSALLHSSYSTLMATAYEPATLNALLPFIAKANPALLSSGTYYLAESEGGPVVGCGGWTHERPGRGEVEDGLAHIRHFATHPEWAGHGIGRSLYNRCETEAKASGAKRFECYASLNAEPFYAALGFTRVRPIDVKMPGGLIMPSIRMERAI